MRKDLEDLSFHLKVEEQIEPKVKKIVKIAEGNEVESRNDNWF